MLLNSKRDLQFHILYVKDEEDDDDDEDDDVDVDDDDDIDDDNWVAVLTAWKVFQLLCLINHYTAQPVRVPYIIFNSG